MPAVRVYGTPVPKGSMRCLGRGGASRAHVLVATNDRELSKWEATIAAAGRALLKAGHGPWTNGEPLIVTLTVTVARPPSVPLRKREWPTTRSSGDIDKHTRSILDGLTASGLIKDDSQVIEAPTTKTYPDTPGVPDRLDRPGVVIRIEVLK